MVQKQLHITRAQNEALKRQAKERGISEEELVRRILSDALRIEDNDKQLAGESESTRQEAIDGLLDSTRELAKGRRLTSRFR